MDVDLILSDFSIAIFNHKIRVSMKNISKRLAVLESAFTNGKTTPAPKLLCRISEKSHSSGLDSHPTTLGFSLPSLDVMTSGFPFESCLYIISSPTSITPSFSHVIFSVQSFSHLYIHIFCFLVLVSPLTWPHFSRGTMKSMTWGPQRFNDARRSSEVISGTKL